MSFHMANIHGPAAEAHGSLQKTKQRTLKGLDVGDGPTPEDELSAVGERAERFRGSLTGSDLRWRLLNTF